MIVMMKINEVIIKDVNMPPDFDEFVEDFAEMSILFIINYFFKYDNFSSHEKLRDMTAIATSLGLLRQTTLLQKVTNLVA